MALINSLTTKPKLNISNIKSPFGSGATISKISAGAGSFIKRSSAGIKPRKSLLNIDAFQVKTNIQNIDEQSSLGRRIDMLSGAVFNINQQLSEVNAIIGDIGNALAMDFANRIANQQQENKALRAQASAEKTSLAEGALEKTKKIGKGIGSGITGVASSVGKTLGLGNILSAAKVLAAGVAINALWPSLEKIFLWSMNNLDKILLVGGAILALNVLGGIGTLLKIGSLFLNPWFWAAMGVLATLTLGYELGKPISDARGEADQKKREELVKGGMDPGKAEQLTQGTRIPDAGGSGSINNMKDIYNDPLGLRNDPLKFNRGGIVPGSGNTDTVPALLTPGEVVIPKELAGRFTQSKVNLLEIDLPTIKKEPTLNQVNPPLPETTEVEYISSINPFNSYMTTTPELHGICA